MKVIKPRLNDNSLWQDLEEYLNEQVCNGVNGSFSEVIEWMKLYSHNVENYREEIITAFSKLFPKAIIRLHSGYDDNSTFFVEIYGISHSMEESNEAHRLSEKFSYDDCKGNYLIIPTFKNLEITSIYYPEIYQEYVKKNNPKNP
jgi:hypothetical protein